ncbi:MAG: hypothetical protein ACQESR_10015, partial [Planctomycetota bacterium]
MRQLFLVMAKLFGLFQIVWAMGYLASLAMLLATMRLGPESLFGHRVAHIANTFGFTVFCLGMAWVLLFRTEWLADKLNVPEETGSKELRAIAILRAGVRLIG